MKKETIYAVDIGIKPAETGDKWTALFLHKPSLEDVKMAIGETTRFYSYVRLNKKLLLEIVDRGVGDYEIGSEEYYFDIYEVSVIDNGG